MTARLPQSVIKRIRDFAWNEFNFGEWHRRDELAKFIRDELGYNGDTPNQYAERFITWAIGNRDFERGPGGQWRWIVHQDTAG